MNFDPIFITDRPVWADKFIIDSCVSIFSISDQSLISYNRDITEIIIKSSKKMTNMNLLSVLFDFHQLLQYEDSSDSSIIINLRKLYALSFFAGQYNLNERCNTIRKIYNIIKELTTEKKIQKMINESLIEIFAATVSFSLAMVSEYYKEIQFTDDNEESAIL